MAEGTMGGTTRRDNFARGDGAPSVRTQYEVLRVRLVTVVLTKGTMAGNTNRDNFARGVGAPSVKAQ